MGMGGREFNNSRAYSYGFSGKEKTTEIGNFKCVDFYDYGYRTFNSRLGNFTSIDPLFSKYTANSPYSAFLNNPILLCDPNGKGAIVSVNKDNSGRTQSVTVAMVIYVYSTTRAIQNEIDCYVNETQQELNNNFSNGKFTTNVIEGDQVRTVKVKFDIRVVKAGYGTLNGAQNLINSTRLKEGDNIVDLNDIPNGSSTFGNSGSWSVNDGKNTRAHEVLHLLGIQYDSKKDPFDHPNEPEVESIMRDDDLQVKQAEINKLNFEAGLTGIPGDRAKFVSKTGTSREIQDNKKYIGAANNNRVFSTPQKADNERVDYFKNQSKHE